LNLIISMNTLHCTLYWNKILLETKFQIQKLLSGVSILTNFVSSYFHCWYIVNMLYVTTSFVEAIPAFWHILQSKSSGSMSQTKDTTSDSAIQWKRARVLYVHTWRSGHKHFPLDNTMLHTPILTMSLRHTQDTSSPTSHS